MVYRPLSLSEIPECYREFARAAIGEHIAHYHIIDESGIKFDNEVAEELNFFGGRPGSIDASDYEHLRNYQFSDEDTKLYEFSLNGYLDFADWLGRRGFAVPPAYRGSYEGSAITVVPPGKSAHLTRLENSLNYFIDTLLQFEDLSDDERADILRAKEALHLMITANLKFFNPTAIEAITESVSASYNAGDPRDFLFLFYEIEEGALRDGIYAMMANPELNELAWPQQTSIGQDKIDAMRKGQDEGASQAYLFFCSTVFAWMLWDHGLSDMVQNP